VQADGLRAAGVVGLLGAEDGGDVAAWLEVDRVLLLIRSGSIPKRAA